MPFEVGPSTFWLFPASDGPPPDDAELDRRFGPGAWRRGRKYGRPAIEVALPAGTLTGSTGPQGEPLLTFRPQRGG